MQKKKKTKKQEHKSQVSQNLKQMHLKKKEKKSRLTGKTRSTLKATQHLC